MRKITLGDLCEPSAGQLKLEKDILVDYFDISSVDNVSKTITGFTTYSFGEAPSRARKAVKRNSILVSTVRPNLNAVALFDEGTDNIPVASTGFCVLDCKMGVDPRFIFNFCCSKTFIDEMTSQATGASYPAVSDKIVRGAKIPDYSEKEQAEISDTLDRVAEVIEMRKRELQKLDDLIKARFLELFGNPVKNDMHWQVFRLGDCLSAIENGKSFTCDNNPRTGNYPAILKLSAVTTGDYRPNENKALLAENQFVESVGIRNGDLLFTRKNTPELVGMAAYVYETPEKLMMPDLIFRLVTNDRMHPIFLWQLINCKEFRPVIQSISNGSAKSMSNISKERLSTISVICPPIEEQKKLEQIMSQVAKSKVTEILKLITPLYMTLTHPNYNLREAST